MIGPIGAAFPRPEFLSRETDLVGGLEGNIFHFYHLDIITAAYTLFC